MKEMKRLVFSVVVLVAGMNAQALEWGQPSAKKCMENESEIKHGTLCYANRDSAVAICEKSGARLPTIDELKAVIDGCSGDADRIHLQKLDTDYEACIERKGFSLRHLYWSSSLYENKNDKAQLMHFTTGVFYASKSYKNGVVYCVKDE